MPPGTGDAQLSLAQIVPLSGGVLVTTPQAVSTYDVAKAVRCSTRCSRHPRHRREHGRLRVRGPRGGRARGHAAWRSTRTGRETVTTGADGSFETVVHIFGTGGAERLSQRYGFPVLGRVPLNPEVRVGGDGGDPIVLTDPDSVAARAFREIAGRLAQRLAIREHKSLPVLQ
jgi:ATP-binding protein involved in chromosome partitioning